MARRGFLSQIRRLRRGVRGAVAVEFALVAPVIAILCIGLYDYGRGIFDRMQLDTATRAAAQYTMAGAFSLSDENGNGETDLTDFDNTESPCNNAYANLVEWNTYFSCAEMGDAGDATDDDLELAVDCTCECLDQTSGSSVEQGDCLDPALDCDSACGPNEIPAEFVRYDLDYTVETLFLPEYSVNSSTRVRMR